MIVEVDLPPELATSLSRLAESASGGQPGLRTKGRNDVIRAALARRLPEMMVIEVDRGLRLVSPPAARA